MRELLNLKLIQIRIQLYIVNIRCYLTTKISFNSRGKELNIALVVGEEIFIHGAANLKKQTFSITNYSASICSTEPSIKDLILVMLYIFSLKYLLKYLAPLTPLKRPKTCLRI